MEKIFERTLQLPVWPVYILQLTVTEQPATMHCNNSKESHQIHCTTRVKQLQFYAQSLVRLHISSVCHFYITINVHNQSLFPMSKVITPFTCRLHMLFNKAWKYHALFLFNANAKIFLLFLLEHGCLPIQISWRCLVWNKFNHFNRRSWDNARSHDDWRGSVRIQTSSSERKGA